MKPFFYLFFIPFFFIACSKSGGSPGNTDTTGTQTAADTLATGWTEVNIPGGSFLVDVFFANNQLGYTVSEHNIYKSTDGGLTWTNFNQDPNAAYDNIAVTPSGNLFITSLGNGIFKSINGGAVTFQQIQNIHGDADIFFTGNDTGYISRGTSGLNTGLWKTIDGGNTWNLIPLSNYSVIIESYLAFNPFAGYCTGANIHYNNSNQDNWYNSSATSSDSFISISAVDDKVAYAAGNSGSIYSTKDGGVNFNTAGTLPGGNKAFVDLAFVNTQTGYATDGSRLYKTTDGGKNWKTEIGLNKNILIEVHFTDEKHGWACGNGGTILVYRE